MVKINANDGSEDGYQDPLSPLMLKVELPAGYKVLLSAPDFDEKSERS